MAGSGDITLDHINDFFSLNKKPKPIHIAPTATGGQGLQVSELSSGLNLSNLRLSEGKGTDYVKKFQEEEDRMLSQSWHRYQTEDGTPSANTVSLSQLSQVEELSTIAGDVAAINHLHNEEASRLYATYMHSSCHNYNKELVITPYRDKLVELIDIHQVVIIQGNTGCGKTTQVPQYILDHCAEKGRHCNIVVTQPRKIAATSIARRVCQERNWKLGSICGYQVSMDSQTSDDTRLCYVTTGVLLQKLIHSRNMNMYTHVIIDEVHERDQDTDFALLVVRKFLRTTSKAVKVILMSATFDTDMFASYFSILVCGKLEPAPVFTVPGKLKAVTEFYLDELRTLGTVPKLDPSNPLIPEESYHIVFQLIRAFDRIEAQEQQAVQDGGLPFRRGAVLIFLPGYFEIGEMEEKLREEMHARKWWILPLHSSVTVDEQTQVFRPPQKGYRKIILSTNIAESSITVPDIKYVIDFCLTKTLYCDRDTNYSCLMLDWASKASCRQRSGRAGRVLEGRVYRMVPYSPEMKRCPLEQVVLMAKKLGMEEPKAVLALALEPPNLEDIERAILVLKEVNALSTVSEGRISPHDGDLTFIGSVMALLPLDVRLSRLIMLGHVFGCLRECIIIAASLHLKSFFSKPFGKLLEAYKSRLAWADGSFSDCLAFLKAYNVSIMPGSIHSCINYQLYFKYPFK
ncbi:ATP-dependent RNA helicase TDRD9-like [Tachypleus tridentatus]|uniref:ATP-dependent RNA helicase TDRD9-like n=1 Tax=Tachypleus tridentatus TaxID=6853 RepID=UPI003FCFFE2F